MDSEINALTESIVTVSPSQWAEANRYMPLSVTPQPGPFSFAQTPYLREIVDCGDIRCSTREAYFRKGAQIGATVGILETLIGYGIAVVKSAPMMLVTADSELAQLRMESNITPMIQQSGLSDKIRSVDEGNSRKTGKTDKKMEWEGGGYLVPSGARNPNKGRSISIQFMLQDEISGWPLIIGKDGDPKKIFDSRTKAYYLTRKIFCVSTPLIKNQSKIDELFESGDQCYYMVPCKHCGFHQVLRWHGINKEKGHEFGIKWRYRDDGMLDIDSVVYVCENCGGEHCNDDKINMLPEACEEKPNGAYWKATAIPKHPDTRSFDLSGLYAPPTFYPWAAAVQEWLDAWDVQNNRPRDLGLLQAFYNNVLGASFAAAFDRVGEEAVSMHRRPYLFGQIPNRFAKKYSESEILLVTAAVDVHGEFLKVVIMGWTKHARSYIIDYITLTGVTESGSTKTEDLSNSCWGDLADIVLNKEYCADDGKKYRIRMTLVDAGYHYDTVVRFCAMFDRGVYAIKGIDTTSKVARIRNFSIQVNEMGGRTCGIVVSLYKDRLSASLKRSWDYVEEPTEAQLQPRDHFNAPENTSTAQLKELTVEYKREKLEKATKKVLGFEWFRPSGSANELWDLTVYNMAALDIICYERCIEIWKLETVNWMLFWEACEKEQLFYL